MPVCDAAEGMPMMEWARRHGEAELWWTAPGSRTELTLRADRASSTQGIQTCTRSGAGHGSGRRDMRVQEGRQSTTSTMRGNRTEAGRSWISDGGIHLERHVPSQARGAGEATCLRRRIAARRVGKVRVGESADAAAAILTMAVVVAMLRAESKGRGNLRWVRLLVLVCTSMLIGFIQRVGPYDTESMPEEKGSELMSKTVRHWIERKEKSPREKPRQREEEGGVGVGWGWVCWMRVYRERATKEEAH